MGPPRFIKKVLTLNVTEIRKDATHQGVVSPKMKLENNTLVTLMTSSKEFQAERKKTRVSYALVVKGVKDVMKNAISAVIKPLLVEFDKIVTDDTPNALLPLRNVQHQIDLSLKTTLLVSISNEVLGFDSIKELYANYEDFGNTWMELETKQYRGEFLLLDGYLFKGNHLCIPKTSNRSQLIKEIHARGLSDHLHGVFTMKLIRLHGVPKSITSDRDNGQTEVVNRTLGNMIRCLCGEKPKLWDVSLAQAKFSSNSAVHSSTGFSPFEVVYKTSPRHVVDLVYLPRKKNIQANRMVEEVQATHDVVRANITEANAKYKFAADKHRRKKLFQVGDEVMVFLRKERFPVGTYSKLEPKKYGLYKILRKINDNAYVVDLPNTMSISKTFNVSDIYEFHSEDVNKGKHSRKSSSKERGNDEDTINELAEEYMEHLERGKIATN
ncbi:transposon ty3-I gag-pol polyprotein [Tanacetum coccineum]